MKLSKKEKERIHRQTLEMTGGHDRGPTFVGVRNCVYDNNHDTKRHKKARRAEGKKIAKAYLG